LQRTFGVWGLGFVVWGLWFGVWGLGFGVESIKVNGIGFVQKVQCVQLVQKVDFGLPMLIFTFGQS